jgi:hypothetical protein
MRRAVWRAVMAVVLAGLVARAAVAQDTSLDGDEARRPVEEESYLAQFGWGMAAIGANLGYMPAKFLYAMGGGLVGLLAYGVTVGDSDTVQGILSPSIGGTWVLTPDNLRNPDTILFVGESYEPDRS